MGKRVQILLLAVIMVVGALVVSFIETSEREARTEAPTAQAPVTTTSAPTATQPTTESPTTTPPPTTKPPTTPPPTTAPPKTTAPPPRMMWKQVLSWDGLAGKDVVTEAFLIVSDSWRIKWGMQGSNFPILTITVYAIWPPEVYLYDIYMIDNPGEDVIYFHEPGMYFLDISSANCQWYVQVEEELPEDEEPHGSCLLYTSPSPRDRG